MKHQNPRECDVILPVHGAFHTQMAFMVALHKMFKQSGSEELADAAGGIVERGSFHHVLSGKHYKRGMHLHKLVYGCLARRVISTTADKQIVLETLSSKLKLLNNEGLLVKYI